MVYNLEINSRALNAIKNGTKIVEIRANTGKIDYSKIVKNDTIKFNSEDNVIVCKVVRNTWYKTIEELLMLEGTKYTLSSTNDYQEGIKSINSLNGYRESIKENGVYAIEIKYMYSENTVWEELYNIAVDNLNPIEKYFIDYGSVSTAILTSNDNIYTGVCIGTSSPIGMCAEGNALSSMINNGETIIKKVVCVGSKKNYMLPCGACCEFMLEMNDENKELEVKISDDKIMKLSEIFPNWWGDFEERNIVEE